MSGMIELSTHQTNSPLLLPVKGEDDQSLRITSNILSSEKKDSSLGESSEKIVATAKKVCCFLCCFCTSTTSTITEKRFI